MIVTFAAIRAKKKADEAREAARLEKRRQYDKAGRERRKAKALAESGLSDLPLATQVAIQQQPPAPASEPAPPADATVAELVGRLEAIKERIFRLAAQFAVSLSWDCVIESNKYLTIFQDLAAQLKSQDEKAYDQIVAGHEAALLSPPIPVKRTVPIELQKAVELRWEVNQTPARRAPSPPAMADGLSWML
jgi:hypothetical protein